MDARAWHARAHQCSSSRPYTHARPAQAPASTALPTTLCPLAPTLQGFCEANKLGSGGYGPVYRGVLDGVPVAIKCLDTSEGAMQVRARPRRPGPPAQPHAGPCVRLDSAPAVLSAPACSLPHRRCRKTRLPTHSSPPTTTATHSCPQGEQEFLQEAQILGRLHHPHIVLLIGVCPQCCMLVYELLDNGNLEEHILGNRGGDLLWQVNARLCL